MTRRIGVTTALATVAGLALAGAPSGLAATTIGSNLAGSTTGGLSCAFPGCTVSHSTLPLASQAPGGVLAPSDGVVVRWRVKVGDVTSEAALRITRPGSSDTRTGAGTGPTVTPPTNQTSTYEVRLPIRAGDALGLDCCVGAFGANFFTLTSSRQTPGWVPLLQDGEPPRLSSFDDPFELLINADVEPDADQDGYGDETQDQCLGTAGPQNGCPVAAPGPTGQPPSGPTGQPAAGEDPKCKGLRKKLKHQKKGLAKATTEKKRSQVEANIEHTKNRLSKLGC